MRQPNDFYPTDARLTQELLKRVEISGTVFECCVGNLAIARELLMELPKSVITNKMLATPKAGK